MIARLRGEVAEKGDGFVLLDVGGVGYEVHLSDHSKAALPMAGEKATVAIYTHVKEDQLKLFGFALPGEKQAFLYLLEVTGIGPKMALAILGGIEVGELISAIIAGEAKRLQKISGVGKRLSERMVVELREKMGRLAEELGPDFAPAPTAAQGVDSRVKADVVEALGALGYSRSEIDRVLPKVLVPGDKTPLPELIRRALRALSPSRR